jgi:hypothetical protein
MKKIRAHLTYANAMSSLAVFLLLGGGIATAAKQNTKKVGATQIKASAVTNAKIKNEAVDTAKLKNGAVTNAKLGADAVGTGSLADGAVTTDKIANDAVNGDKINESTLSEVPSANSANPAVFAAVNATGTVDAGGSKGLTSPNVSHGQKGVYCITVPAFAPRGGQVTVRGTGGATGAQLAVGGTGACPFPAVQVSIWNPNAVPAGPDDAPFYIELYR